MNAYVLYLGSLLFLFISIVELDKTAALFSILLGVIALSVALNKK